MDSVNFPGLAAHRAQHQQMVAKLAEIVAGHEKNDTAAYLQFLYFMRDYWTKHLKTEDGEYAKWLAAMGPENGERPLSERPTRFH